MTATTQSVRKGINKINNIVMTSAYMSTNQSSLTNNSWTKLNLNTVSYDVGSNFDTTNHKFIAPVTGLYRIRGVVHFTSVIATKQYGAALYKNGSAIKYAFGHSSTTDDISIPVDTEVFLKQNDYIELFANPNAGASTVAALSGSQYTSLIVRLITKEGIRQ